MEDQTILLAFHDCIWELAEPENRAEEAPPSDLYPPFLYALADFMQSRKRWEGTATELVEAVAETEIKPKGVVRCLSRFYFEFLEPRGIRFHAHRTGQSRLICLACDDANDVNDDNDEKLSGQLSGQKKPSVENANFLVQKVAANLRKNEKSRTFSYGTLAEKEGFELRNRILLQLIAPNISHFC